MGEESGFIKFTFIDMGHRDFIHTHKLEVQYNVVPGRAFFEQANELNVAYQNATALIMILTLLLIMYHYKFQVLYHLCLFRNALCAHRQNQTQKEPAEESGWFSWAFNKIWIF